MQHVMQPHLGSSIQHRAFNSHSSALLLWLLMFAGDTAVLCPVCKASHLAQRHGRLVCPGEGWQLNLAAESLTLEDVKDRLAAAYEVGGLGMQVLFAEIR